ncbi:MAG: hypothetical protein QXG73_02255, partial [Candidatus Micrarchaeaceae archaeon]
IVANVILFAILLLIRSALGMLSDTFQMLVGAAIVIFVYPVIVPKLKAADQKDFNIIKKLSSGIPIFGLWFRNIVEYAEKFM